MEEKNIKNFGASESASSENKPKPLRRLKRVSDETAEHIQHEIRQPQNEMPKKGKYEADSPAEGINDHYHAAHEAAPKLVYKNRKKQPENIQQMQAPRYPSHVKNPDPVESDEMIVSDLNDDGSIKDALIKIVSVIASIFIIGAMCLNMPMFVDRDTKKNVSAIYLVKHWQPIAKEGQLDKTEVMMNVSGDTADNWDDGLDLPQLIEGQYSVLLLGFDEDEFNSDVMWILQFDIGHGELNILQIPRDCCLPDFTSSPTGKLNSCYSMGDPNVIPIQRVVNAMQQNFGIPIDAYVTTACFDIVDMVDLVGGIPIHLDNEIIYEADKIIPEGDIVLTGEQAEWFIRFRSEWLEGDIGRMMNQRRFMVAAMNKLLSIVNDEGRLKLYGYLKEIYDNELLYTDLSLDDMSKIANFASTLTMDNVRVNMVPGEGAIYYAPDENEYDVFSVHKQPTIDMLNEYYRPYQSDMTSYDTAIVELITDYSYTGYDDTGSTLEELETATEPERDPNKKPWWKE